MPIPPELNTYVYGEDSAFSWEEVGAWPGKFKLSVVTQRWHGILWRHDVVVRRPSVPVAPDIAILWITGWDPNPLDLTDAAEVAAASGLPVAMLFQMPVQPIDGRTEDDLIAHTFEAYLETADPTLPLLLPMAKSVIRVMDALESWSGGSLKRFVLMGESKRAWTAWMAAATGDPRIVGIVPTAFDNLRMDAQLEHQLALWGATSPEIKDYTDRNLPERSRSHSGEALVRLVDPYHYLGSLRARVLTICGACDPFWTVDAESLYADQLPANASRLTLPNEGHDFSDKRPYFEAAAAFARACALHSTFPSMRVEEDGPALRVHPMNGLLQATAYVANRADGRFAEAHWEAFPLEIDAPWALPHPEARYQAHFIVGRFHQEVGGTNRSFPLSTRPLIRS